jgi:transcription initiation protein SPT3
MMLIRHDKAKLARLRHFLQWKDVRKNVKEADDNKDAGADVGGGGEADIAGPSGPQVEMKKNKKARVDLVWDVPSYFSEMVPPRDDEEDEEEEEMTLATLQRLKYADERTKDMSKEDYMHWSECRQASFTFRKGRRFRDWAGFGVITDAKPNDDIIDILGFLTYEIVQTLTEEALRVKEAEDLWKKRNGGEDAGKGGKKKRQREPGLFDWPDDEREPVQPGHVREAFRRLQMGTQKTKAMAQFSRRVNKQKLKFVSAALSLLPSHWAFTDAFYRFEELLRLMKDVLVGGKITICIADGVLANICLIILNTRILCSIPPATRWTHFQTQGVAIQRPLELLATSSKER